jgi:hypothetical protein
MKTLLELRHHARELWSDPFMARQWIRAVHNARKSDKGWILDQAVKRKDESS